MLSCFFFQRMPELLYDILCVKSVLFLDSLPILKVFNLDIWKIKIFVKTIFVLNNLILDAWWNVNNQNNCPFYLSFLQNWAKFVKFTEVNLHDPKLQTLTDNVIHLFTIKSFYIVAFCPSDLGTIFLLNSIQNTLKMLPRFISQ